MLLRWTSVFGVGASAFTISSGLISDACLGLTSTSTAVQISSCASAADWTFADSTANSTKLLQSNGKCLQVNSLTDGSKLEVAACSPTNTRQQWTRSGNTLVSQGTYCLDLTDGNGAAGNRPQIWTCYPYNGNQAWKFADKSATVTTTSSQAATTSTKPATSTIKSSTSLTTSKSTSSTTSLPSTTLLSVTRTSTTSSSRISTTTSTSTTAALVTSVSSAQITVKTAPGLCIDTTSASNGAAIQLSTCSSTSTTQQWALSGGTITTLGGTKCLDVPNGNRAAGATLQIWDCFAGNVNQQWTRIGDTLVSANSVCVSLPSSGATASQVLQLKACVEGDLTQQFVWANSTVQSTMQSTTTFAVPSTTSKISTSSASKATQTGTIRLIGRTSPGPASPSSPQTLSWGASGVSITFIGSTTIGASMTFSGNPVFAAYLDGNYIATIYSVSDLQTVSGLDPSVQHTVTLLKVNEGAYGTAVFNGFLLDPSATILPTAAPSRRIEFIGDSLTNGYGNLGTVAGCAADYTNENTILAFGPVVASALSAEVSVIAAQGFGAFSDWQGNRQNTLPNIYGLSAYGGSASWNFATASQTDLVVIHLGANDYYPITWGLPTSYFTTAYTDFLTTVRQRNPNAWIVPIFGPRASAGMSDTMTPLIRAAVDAYVSQSGDTKVTFVTLDTPSFDLSTHAGEGCQQHPNTAVHAAMAESLKPVLRSLLNW